MAKITISFHDDTANTTDSYDTTLSDATLARIVDDARTIYGIKGATPGSPVTQINKNQARKRLTKEAIQYWKNLIRDYETKVAVAAIAPIDTVEV